MISVYVAAPFVDSPLVREVHERLVLIGARPTSSWAEQAQGPEDFTITVVDVLRDAAAANDRDLRASDVCLVLAREGVGGEMFAESRMAIAWQKAVVWVGRRTLSAWRRGVVRADDLDDAIAIVAEMAEPYALGRRGVLLAESIRVRGAA